jgi:hypothetical protein
MAGSRKVESIDEQAIIPLIEKLSPVDSMINVHGGEPFAGRRTREAGGSM